MPPPDSVYPAALDDFPVIEANSGEAAPGTEHDVVHEHVHQAVKAVQETLGITGSAVAGTVHKRLDELEAAVTELEAAIGDVELEGVVTTDTAQDIAGDKDFFGRIASRTAFLTTAVLALDDVLSAAQTREVDLDHSPVQTLLTEFDLTLDATGPAAAAGWVVLYVYNAGTAAIDVTRGTGWFGSTSLSVEADETCKFHLHWDGVRMSAGLVEAAGTASGDLRPAPTVLAITGGPLIDATEGEVYSDTLSISGGVPPYTLSIVTGLPAGLTAEIDGSTVEITGTPDAGESSGSPFSLSIEVEDAEADTEIYTQSFVVNSATTATWDAGVLSAPGVLSDSDARLTANTAASGTYASTRSTSALTGNCYFEIVVRTDALGGIAGAGVADETVNLGDAGVWCGSGLSCGYWGPSSSVFYNGSGLFALAYAGNPNRIEIAVRVGSRRIWIRNSGGSWVGGGDPAADSSPTVTLGGSGPLYAAATVTKDLATANRYAELLSDPAAMTGSVPTGFSAGIFE